MAVSAAVAGGVWAWTRDPGLAFLSWWAGVFVDADHGLDFVLFERRLPRSAGEFLDYYLRDHRYKRIQVLLHGWEYAAGLWGLAWWWWPTPVGWVLALSYSHHLVLDQFVNNHLHPWAYSLAFRAWHGFSKDVIMPPERAARILETARRGNAAKV